MVINQHTSLAPPQRYNASCASCAAKLTWGANQSRGEDVFSGACAVRRSVGDSIDSLYYSYMMIYTVYIHMICIYKYIYIYI